MCHPLLPLRLPRRFQIVLQPRLLLAPLPAGQYKQLCDAHLLSFITIFMTLATGETKPRMV